METGFLNFHDEEHFSDFSLSLEQNLVEKPQDLLMHMVENDFDYMETHLDITNSDSLWNNEHKHNEGEDEMSVTEMPTISKIDSIKEDFAKVLTDWQEHIGYLQASDMDEYMDIIGLNMNAGDKRNFCSTENILQDEQQTMHTLESDVLTAKQEDLAKEGMQNSQIKPDPKTNDKDCETKNDSYHKGEINAEANDNKRKAEARSLLIQPKHTRNQSKLKKNIHKYDSIGIDMSSNLLAKQKMKKKGKALQRKKETRREKQEKSVNQLPVLEAGDVKSLLEQFEASESTLISTSRIDAECKSDSPAKCNETQSIINQSEVSNLHKNIRDALPKEVIEKIKTSARKKVISVIPAIPSIQRNGRSNGTRMQDAAASLFRNKLLKIVTTSPAKSKSTDGSVQLDHDYCSPNSSISSSESNSEYERHSSDSEKVSTIEISPKTSSNPIAEKSSPNNYLQSIYSSLNNANRSQAEESKQISMEYPNESNSKKDSGLESGEVSDNGEEQSESSTKSQKDNDKVKETLSINSQKQQQEQQSNSSPLLAQPEMKIQSALATSILQLRESKATQRKQMVSVLKSRQQTKESVVTTINSSNDEVRNIIIREELEKKPTPPRKKLNLAEYRSRREQNRSDNSRTSSPLQPMTLVYVHHASTTTEPIKDDPTNLIWSEREIVSVLKPKAADAEEKKERKDVVMREVAIQTYETVFEFPAKKPVDVDERHEKREESGHEKNQRSYKRHRIDSTSSRSRSRSNSKSKSRSRSRSSSNRSRSRKRGNTRHRRISHRRSSVSSSSSWSSRSRSHSRSRSRSRSSTRSTFTSGSRYSRSRSRSSRSRSRSSSRYSSCSRSSSRSNFGRSKWSRRRRRDRRYDRSYDRHRQHSASSYAYRDWRRSPANSYRRSYDNWYDREKQRQVEERRVIYVGRLDEGITKADLRRRFESFGPVVDISIHFREHGDNYGFVTFAYKNDAYEAVEHGNDDPALPRYDLCFGGRRAFCKVKYADLDGMASNSLNSSSSGVGNVSGSGGHMLPDNEDNTFDLLLKEAKAKLRKRKV